MRMEYLKIVGLKCSMMQEWNDEFKKYFNTSIKGEGTILASQDSYGQYKERPLKRGFHRAIPITKLERIEPLKKHKLETHFDAKIKCEDVSGQVNGLRWGFYTKFQGTNSLT